MELMLDQRINLLLSVGEECVTVEELNKLLINKPNFRLYDGFEPSGRMHIAQGIFKAMNVNKCIDAGGTFVFWIADWFALMNDKMGGDLEKIKNVGRYLIEVWKAVGMDMSRVEFLLSSEEINKNALSYWTQMLDIARNFGINRITKCCTIMGRNDGNLTAAQILYPLMQCTDIFFLKADICQLGVDQRKVNMLAREYCESVGKKLKPIILSHHMLYGLVKGQPKMSKSLPNSAIFMEDTTEQIRDKIMKAYCPRIVEDDDVSPGMTLVEDKLKNPCLDYVKHIIFSNHNNKMVCGDKVFTSAKDVEDAFIIGDLNETNLKEGIICAIDDLIKPVREHFENNEDAKKLLEMVISYNKEGNKSRNLMKLTLKKDKLTHVVFAPFAHSSNLELGVLVDIIKRLESVASNHEPILFISDWSSFVLNCFNGNKKVIASTYIIFVESLKTLNPVLMRNVRIILQSEAILSDPNSYWISVINAGRNISLDRVKKVGENNQVGFVVATLMHVADVLATDASVLHCNEDWLSYHLLAMDYFKLLGISEKRKIHVTYHQSLILSGPLDSRVEDLSILSIDMVADVNRKIKKAFCEPTNIKFNPPLRIIEEFGFKSGHILVPKCKDDGVFVSYTKIENMILDFEQGILHPSDMKTVVMKIVNDILEPLRENLKSESGRNAVNDIKQFMKNGPLHGFAGNKKNHNKCVSQNK